jgi:hypothetical protein
MYLLRTVRLTLVFLVGDFLKSTRHRYIPPSVSRTLSTVNLAGSSVYRKNALPPRTCSSAQCFAWSKDFPRESKLQQDMRFSGYISCASMWTLGVPFQLYCWNLLFFAQLPNGTSKKAFTLNVIKHTVAPYYQWKTYIRVYSLFSWRLCVQRTELWRGSYLSSALLHCLVRSVGS